MPKLLFARAPKDPIEERKICKLAGARHAPADWIRRAQIIALSWERLRVPQIARELGCAEKTVRYRLTRFNAEGLDGLGDRPGAGRKRRISEAERSQIIALARTSPPGRPVRDQATGELSAADEAGPGSWTLDTLTQAVHGLGQGGGALAGATDPAGRGGALAPHPLLGRQPRPGVRPKRTRLVALYPCPPPGVTVVAADELGPVLPRTFESAPGWSADGRRIKDALEYSREPEKTWVYGGLRVADGHAVTMCAPSRNSIGWQRFLALLEKSNPTGTITVITDNLSSYNSVSTRQWLTEHPRIQQVFIPKGACWLNLQEAWWRIFRRQALAGQTFADPDEIAYATAVATRQLNTRARPWIWGRPIPSLVAADAVLSTCFGATPEEAYPRNS
ncbi:transposase (plasmid) [Streptosporangium sp. CA-135522]|uniref:transposase n=1 Tax=Streptosporangium sp. CA-135522 TaxID=3240072 RepID=UPI003D90FB01